MAVSSSLWLVLDITLNCHTFVLDMTQAYDTTITIILLKLYFRFKHVAGYKTPTALV